MDVNTERKRRKGGLDRGVLRVLGVSVCAFVSVERAVCMGVGGVLFVVLPPKCK